MEKLKEGETIALRNGRCPDCGLQLYEGPSGGIAVNVACVNGHRFLVAGPFTPERITDKPKDS